MGYNFTTGGYTFYQSPPPQEITIVMVDPLGQRFTVVMPMETWRQIKHSTPEYAAEQRRLREEEVRRQEAAFKKAQEEFAKQARDAEEKLRYFNHAYFDEEPLFAQFFGPGSSRGVPSGGNRAKPKAPTSVIELIKLAGVETEEAAKLTVKQLYRKAQRRCHPDTGGSHDLWLKLEKLVPYLDI